MGVLKDGINAIESGSYTLRKYIHAGFQMGKQSSCSSTAAVVEALKLQKGDHIEITIAGEREFKVGRDSTRENALKRLRSSKWALPPGFKFDRAEANER